MEIEEMIKRVAQIKKLIEEAFEKGSIDFDEITSELEMIQNELQSKGIAFDSEISRQHLLKAKNLSEHRATVNIGDFR